MKSISKLKLTQLSKAELAQRQMNMLKGGGDTCGCACAYSEATGGDGTGSSINANSGANAYGGYTSYGGNHLVCSKYDPNSGGYLDAGTV